MQFLIKSLLKCHARLTVVYYPFRAAAGLTHSDLHKTPSEVKTPLVLKKELHPSP